MKTSEIRTAYLQFFAERGHKIVPSDSLVPEHDPTLLFTGAGMNQFKDQFLGKNLTFRRAASCQKCFRADDIDEVGKTACHHTFFEMLGNFSFGDYFKREAIEWAWEFLIGRLRINPGKLSVSVYKDDKESYAIWKEIVGVPEGGIYRLGEHDNFWPADAPSKSPAGTLCGPCTEIFFDMGPQPHCPDPAKCDITCDCKRYVEIWNLVLQQFQKGEKPGELIPLTMKNIDTGMGLERTAAVMQGVMSNFDNDVFKPIVGAVLETLGVRAEAGSADMRCVRRIADHVRAVSFLVADGVLPANDGRGYVERRLIRRAMRDGLDLGAKEAFLYAVVPAVADVMKDAYPEIAQRRENIARVMQAEEERFETTLANGSRLLKELVADMKSKGRKVLPGEEAFRLYDTYGLPLELTEDILEESGMTTDHAGFEREMERQRAQARGASSMSDDVFDTGPLGKIKGTVQSTTTVTTTVTTTSDGSDEEHDGEEEEEEEGQCEPNYPTSLDEPVRAEALLHGDEVRAEASEGDEIELILDRTCFYGEAGGQVGDTGSIVSDTGRMEVQDTKRTAGYVRHIGRIVSGTISSGQQVWCHVDVARRDAIRRAHTATHLLQNALRRVLGKHVEQAGSLVAADRLRFDFSHFAGLSADEIERVEQLVNENILRGAQVTATEMPIEQAKAAGAMALFGEKYGEVVRVVRVGEYSMELCGGTHLDKASEIGLFRVVSESSVAAGTRRIEAVTGREAIEHGRRRERTLEQVAEILGSDETRVLDRAARLLDENRELKAEVKKLKKQGGGQSADEAVEGAVEVAGVKLVVRKTDLKMNDLRELCDVLKRKLGSGVVVLGSDHGGKLALLVGVTKDLTPQLDAGKMIKDMVAVIGGSGGGRPDLAQAGGKDPAQLDAVLAAAVEVVKRYAG